MAYASHKRSADSISARCAAVTLSDTRTEADDASGTKIRDLLIGAGHAISHYSIVREEPAAIETLLRSLLARVDIDAIITSGGTGIARRDQTIPVIERLLDTPLPGFGELFRFLSHEQIGSGAMLSRAMAGIAAGKPVFCLPGSVGAVELGMSRLILPELKHLLFELRK